MDGPVHRYMLSSPGCWHLHGELSSGRYARTQLSVDGYAVQHPGIPGPQASQSVCVHLLNLGRVLERGGRVEDGPRFLQKLAHRTYPWLPPPAPGYELTVVDLVASKDSQEFADVERRFSEVTWKAWSAHHVTIRGWLDDPGSLPPPRPPAR